MHKKRTETAGSQDTAVTAPFGNTILSFDGSALYEHRYVQPYT